VTEVEIDWLDGSGYHELTDRERALMDKARQAGYAAGEKHGYRVGGEDALRASTTLATLLQDRRTLKALETLVAFLHTQEDERGSVYWDSRA
jgi:hypothetical protein